MDDHMRLPKIRKRAYRQAQRADKTAETHRMLTKAAFELHATVGPARTTVSAIAERAGVQRLTVYRHFPDDAAIFAACTAYSVEHDPPPNPDLWSRIVNPRDRVTAALRDLYGYYAKNRQLLSNVYRDGELPVVAASLTQWHQVLERCVGILMEGHPATADPRRLKAAIGHVLDFATWRSLTETQGLDQATSIPMAAGFIESASR